MKKTCFKCNQELDIDCFYKHKMMADGHLNKCIECAKKDVIDNRLYKVDYYREYDRARGSRHKKGYTGNYRKLYTNKYIATNMVNNAIRDKRLFRKSCEICGNEKTHAHHDDYLMPLNVRWLCAVHHTQWHRNNGEGKNGRYDNMILSEEKVCISC